MNRAKTIGLDNVIFIDSVPKEEVSRYWSLLDVCIIHLKKDPLFKTVIPSKLFECMGMGIPVLHGVQGESAGIVEQEKAGLLFEPENADELVTKLILLKNDTRQYTTIKKSCFNGATKYDRSKLAQKMLKYLVKILKETKI